MTTSASRAYRARHNGRSVADRAQSKACAAAVKYIRQKHPRVWQRLLDDAYTALGAERKPPGRPKQ